VWYAAAVLGGAPTAFGAVQALSAAESPVRLTMLLLWSTRVGFAGLPAAAAGLLQGILVAALVALVTLLLVTLLLVRLLGAARVALDSPGPSSTPARPGAGSAAGRTGSGRTAGRRPASGQTTSTTQTASTQTASTRVAASTQTASTRAAASAQTASTQTASGPGAGVPARPAGADSPGGAGGAPVVVVVGAVTGTVGRAWLGGRVWTVRTASGRLREGGRYRVLRRQGEVLEVLSQ
jgi:hypothetical protein